MKIYFAGSIRGGRILVDSYRQLIEFLKQQGELMSDHVGNPTLTKKGEKKDKHFIYERDVNWLKECDMVVADVSIPSLGVGVEIALAQNMGKKIIAAYNINSDYSLSPMVEGNPNVKVLHYGTVEEAKKLLSKEFEEME